MSSLINKLKKDVISSGTVGRSKEKMPDVIAKKLQLTICYNNARSLRNKTENYLTLLNDQSPDLICLTETHFPQGYIEKRKKKILFGLYRISVTSSTTSTYCLGDSQLSAELIQQWITLKTTKHYSEQLREVLDLKLTKAGTT